MLFKTWIEIFAKNVVFQIELGDIPGTGRDGRILKEDVLNYIERMKAKPTEGEFLDKRFIFLEQIVCLSTLCNVFTAPAPTVEVAAPTTPPSTQIARPGVVLEDRTEAIKGIRRAMAKAMTASLTIPHFGYKDEVILNELVR